MFEDKIRKLNEETEKTSPFIIEKRVYTVDEVMDILDVGKNVAYDLIKSNTFHVIKVGGQYRISKKSFDKWLDGVSGGD